MDFEAHLRRLIGRAGKFEVKIGTTPEGRVLIVVESDLGPRKFLMVENTAIPVPADEKPPTQQVAATGFDAHRGMGARA